MNLDTFKHGVKLTTEEMPEIFRRYQRATKFGGKMGNFRAKMSNNSQNEAFERY